MLCKIFCHCIGRAIFGIADRTKILLVLSAIPKKWLVNITMTEKNFAEHSISICNTKNVLKNLIINKSKLIHSRTKQTLVSIKIYLKNQFNLMYVIPQQGLVTRRNYSVLNFLSTSMVPPRGLAWTKVKDGKFKPYVYPVSSQNPFDPPGLALGNPLQGDSLIIYYYFKNVQFFTDILSALKKSVVNYSEFKFYCKKIVFPQDIYCGNLEERTFYVSGEFLKQVYDLFLRGQNQS